MKKMPIPGGKILVASTKKQERMLDKLHSILAAPGAELQRYKVTFKIKRGTVYRILDDVSAEAACVSTGAQCDQILSVELVGKDTPCTANKLIEED